MIAHIQNGKVLRTYPEGKGRLIFDNGDTLSPIVSGYDNGTDKLLPVRLETVDQSLTNSFQKTSEYIIKDVEVIHRYTVADVPPTPVAPKLAGIEFDGVMCSATGTDQAGLVAILTSIQLQGATFPNTRFEFENGSVLIIGLHNYEAFTEVWLPFRQSFFQPSS